jgi:hypothetical protein
MSDSALRFASTSASPRAVYRTVFEFRIRPAERDIAGVVLNRWGHHFVAPQLRFKGRDGVGGEMGSHLSYF